MESSVAQRRKNNFASPNSPSFQHSSAADVSANRRKRMKVSKDEEYDITSKVYHSCQFTVADFLEELEGGKYGSVTKEIKDLWERRMDFLKPYYAMIPTSPCRRRSFINEATGTNQQIALLGNDVDKLEDDHVYQGVRASEPIVINDSDEEEPGDQRPSSPCQDVVLNMPAGTSPLMDSKDMEHAPPKQASTKGNESLVGETNINNDKGLYVGVENDLTEENNEQSDIKDDGLANKGIYVGVEDDLTEESNEQSDIKDDGLADIWQEMTFAIECSKETSVNPPSDEHIKEDGEECEHSFLLKDDLGYVCRICGVIQRGIESIIEFQYAKRTSTRTYKYEAQTTRDEEATEILHGGMRFSGHNFLVADLAAHPRHSKIMKSHQVEGFNFLVSNLVTDNPGGCILAHAPGSGKTFMVISFIQSFMAKYPFARPLVILPRGILPTWKKEFLLWQVEDIPLLDFYSVKADSRSQQLEVLKQWAGERSILFLGYKQFSSIVCDNDTSKTSAACQEILLTHPSLLILDEGHTPRNENTDQLAALEKVQTPRKVVLSGTLYQNHVKEVFNILNLVRPKFLRLETCKAIKRRILSRVTSSKKGNMLKKGDNEFYELVEESLLKDEDLKRRAVVIQDLREMTSKVLHYYKGDFLDELPGLVDFTLFLNLSPRQKREVKELKKLGGKFKISSDGSAIYVHPQLKYLTKNTAVKDRIDQVKIDKMLEKLDEKEGVKAMFYLNLLHLCESSGEKLLVFSQYLLPMKFLERLTVKVKGWSPGKEIFMITGDLDSETRESHMECFNNSPDARVFFGSIKACSEGISLVGASRIIVLDVHLNPSVTRQAIGRAFRPGQARKVYTYRLVAAGSPEEEDHSTCFKKESIAKLWFEWNECCGPEDFHMESADVTNCGDIFLETPCLHEDVISLYRR